MEGGATCGSGVRTDVSTDRKGSPGTPVADEMALKKILNKYIKQNFLHYSVIIL